MKLPLIVRCFTSAGARKWHCTSKESGAYGPYEREGKGYTPLEAYQKWERCGDHTSRRYS